MSSISSPKRERLNYSVELKLDWNDQWNKYAEQNDSCTSSSSKCIDHTNQILHHSINSLLVFNIHFHRKLQKLQQWFSQVLLRHPSVEFQHVFNSPKFSTIQLVQSNISAKLKIFQHHQHRQVSIQLSSNKMINSISRKWILVIHINNHHENVFNYQIVINYIQQLFMI